MFVFKWTTSYIFFFFFFKGRKKDFGKVMGVFLRIIGPLAEAIQGPSVYFDVIFFYGVFIR
jgi:hypothetical protein